MSRGYQDLIVWQKAMDLVELVYCESASLPSDERFGLTSQIRRAAVSVPSNVAEGNARSSDRDFARFLEIALGSLAELETQILLAVRLGMLNQERCTPILTLAAQVGRLLTGLHRSKSNARPEATAKQ
ncbi:MAG: four helix bundle protein [Pirellula sp.]|nr:four helix bundle protein [Pirellula sp.]